MDVLARTRGWKQRIGTGARRGAVTLPPAAHQAMAEVRGDALMLVSRIDTVLGEMQHAISAQVEENLRLVRWRLGDGADLTVRAFDLRGSPPLKAGLAYIDGLVDAVEIDTQVMKALMRGGSGSGQGDTSSSGITARLRDSVLTVANLRLASDLDDLVEAVLAGDTALFVEGCASAFVLGLRNAPHRAIEEPATEASIRGPREGFTEPLRLNLGLIRRRLQTPTLRVVTFHLGRRTKTQIAICFLEDVASPALVREVRRRLEAIDIDGIMESGYLEQFIEDNHFSPFPQVLNTERPDKAVANLLEGRVVILTDGTPFALVAPTQFTMFYQAAEDYYDRVLIGVLVRGIRLLALIAALTFPSLYVALVSFNPEMIPTKFAVAVAGGRAGVPVPAVIEVLLLEVVMEILREASLHLPKQIGGAISIVGVLVIGQAAVSSGFVSPITVVVVAMSAIGSFAIPAFNAASALRLLRFPLIALSGLFGLYGVMVGLILIVNHMLSLESFGIPYMAPISPLTVSGLRDAVLRAPLWTMPDRPRLLATIDSTRLGNTRVDVLDEKRPVLDPGRGQGGESP